MNPLQIATVAVWCLAVAGVLVYGLHAWAMLALAWRHRQAGAVPEPLGGALPVVTVQLPLYNERYVAARVLDSIAALEYPKEKLEIQVLDDSTDDTPAIVAHVIASLRTRGFEVSHVRRRRRTGFKAGALAEGVARARGEFVAIFDADFVPPPDVLRRLLASFEPDVACVQARWGHLNRGYSVLTRAQATALDAHFVVDQAARAWNGLLMQFDGTAGIWRKTAIVDAGGWDGETLSEDLDLSYRAGLRGWRIVYRGDVECPAELPVLATAFKHQQRRWAIGFTQAARKHLPAVLSTPLGRWSRLFGGLHLTSWAIHPLVLVTLALTPILAGNDATAAFTGVGYAALAIAVLGSLARLVYAQHALGASWTRRIIEPPLALIATAGLTFSASFAVIAALIGRRRPDWARTPKFGISEGQGTWRGKAYAERASGSALGELILGIGCALAAWDLWDGGAYAALPFIALYAVGFLAIGALTLAESLGIAHDRAAVATRVPQPLGAREIDAEVRAA